MLADAYREEEVEGEPRVVLALKPSMAPIKVGVFPLVKKDGMPELARRVHGDLRMRFNVFYDDGGSIGRRYRRQDEAGTPYRRYHRWPKRRGSDGDGPGPRYTRPGPHRDRQTRHVSH